jgi:histidine triad (HIT) family protein
MTSPADQDCIFCRVAAGSLGATFVYESDNVVAFDDLEPRAETHVLIIPRRHLSSATAVTRADDVLLGELFEAATSVARDRGIDRSGFRLLTNHGEDAGHSVFHLHFHLLGGNRLGPLG